MKSGKMNTTKQIAILAFESKKTDLIEWSYFNRNVLASHEIYAFGPTADTLEGTLIKSVKKLEPIIFGGYKQLYNLLSEEKIDMLVIFANASEIFESKDLDNVLRVATEHNVLVAANRTTADFIVNSSLLTKEYLISKQQSRLKDRVPEIKPEAPFLLAKAS